VRLGNLFTTSLLSPLSSLIGEQLNISLFIRRLWVY
jgi:hypothetical protein